MSRTIADLVYASFGKNVVALDRYTGELVWKWAIPKGAGYTALLLDGDRLIVSAHGYTYCLDPLFGQEVWQNPLKGLGVGVPCLASAQGGSTALATGLAMSAQAAQARAAAT